MEGFMVKQRMLVKGLPQVVFITDNKRVPHFETVIASLPNNAAVIIRDYDHPDRYAYAHHIVELCKSCGVTSIVAGDAQLARKVGADGLHLAEYQLSGRRIIRHNFSIITAAAKSQLSMRRAATLGVNMVLFSPIFKTQSHRGVSGLGIHVLSRTIMHAPLPVAALGGINDKTLNRLNGIDIACYAAIDGLADI